MNVRRDDGAGDYVLGRANNRLRDSAAVQALVAWNLRLAWGEWFLDPTAGVSMYDLGDGNQAILGDRPDQAFTNAELKRVVLTTAGISQIVSFIATPDHETRRLAVGMVVATVYGEAVPVEVVLP